MRTQTSIPYQRRQGDEFSALQGVLDDGIGIVHESKMTVLFYLIVDGIVHRVITVEGPRGA